MDMSAGEKCLVRLGTSLNELYRQPSLFLSRLHPLDRSKYGNRLRDCIAESELSVIFYDDNNRARRDKVQLGSFVEYVDEETSSLKVGLVVGCMLSRVQTGAQTQDLALLIELPGANSETAQMPPPDSVCRIVSTSAITSKIDVEQRQNPSVPAKMLTEDAGFVLCVNSSFYGLDLDGTHTIGSYVTNLLSISQSRRGEMFATTENSKILSVELNKGRVKEVGSTRLFETSRKSHHETEFSGHIPIQIVGLCFAEGRPAAFDPKVTPGACQMYGIGKNIINRGGDCLCSVTPSGRCEIVFELGRRDVVALAVVPIRLSANEPVNPWSRVGPSDANPKSMRFIIWTEQGGLFVVDETRRSLQQLGGDLVRSLEISAIAFDLRGELYAAGSQYLYQVSPTGTVVDVAPLAHLPGQVNGICATSRELAHPGLYDEEDLQEQNIEPVEEKTRSRSKSWWSLSRGNPSTASRSTPALGNTPSNSSFGSTLLRLFRIKSKSTQQPPKEIIEEDRPRAPKAAMFPQSQGFSSNNGSFSGRRVSNPLLPMEGTSMGETNRRGSGTLTKAPTFETDYLEDEPPPPPPQRKQQKSPSQKGPYFPAEDYEDDEIEINVAEISPPKNPPPPSTIRKDSPSILRPPATAPPPTTARAVTENNSFSPSKIDTSTRYRDVPSMLHSIGLPQYVANFRQEEITDMSLLVSMFKNDIEFKNMLKDIGIAKLGHRELIAHAVKQYQG